MDTINCRQFVGASLAATAGMLNASALAMGNAENQPKSSQMKVGLYTITYLGVWYRGNALPLQEAIKRTKSGGGAERAW